MQGVVQQEKKSSSSGDRQIRMKKGTLETTRWREAERRRGGETEAQRETDGKRVDVWIGINTGGGGTRRSGEESDEQRPPRSV